MNTRKIGPLEIYPVGLGCMNICSGYQLVTEDHAKTVLREAVGMGYDFFDTATLYGGGRSEKLVGEVLKPHRQKITLASKCGLDGNGIDGSPATLIAQCEQSLQRLKTDVIDLYYLHRVDPNIPIADSVGTLQRLLDEGKIRSIGLSEVSTQTLQAALDETPIAALQSEYSLWSRTPEFGILDLCEKHNVAFVPFCPLGRGFLAGSAQEISELGEKDLRRLIAHPRFEGENYTANCELLAQFKQVAATQNCSPGQLALAWLMHQQDHTMIPIPGTTNTDHLKENFDAAHVTLDPELLESINQLINEQTVQGKRYNDDRMKEVDSERDRVAA